jgi:hypothetical protein
MKWLKISLNKKDYKIKLSNYMNWQNMIKYIHPFSQPFSNLIQNSFNAEEWTKEIKNIKKFIHLKTIEIWDAKVQNSTQYLFKIKQLEKLNSHWCKGCLNGEKKVFPLVNSNLYIWSQIEDREQNGKATNVLKFY